MTAQHLRCAVEQVCRNEARRAFAVRSDGDLLGVFVESGDEDAFAELVARHGAMVLGTCCRALRNTADAEDAFQAVFLVLARRAASISPREQVGSWLYGVAVRTARKARLRKQAARTGARHAFPRR